jgi:hypothetical protein
MFLLVSQNLSNTSIDSKHTLMQSYLSEADTCLILRHTKSRGVYVIHCSKLVNFKEGVLFFLFGIDTSSSTSLFLQTKVQKKFHPLYDVLVLEW